MIRSSIRELKTKSRTMLMGQYSFFVMLTFILLAAQYLLNTVIDYAFPLSAQASGSLLYFACSLLSNILYVILLAGAHKVYLNRVRGLQPQHALFFGFTHQPEHIAPYAVIRFLLSFILSEAISWFFGEVFSSNRMLPLVLELLIFLLITMIFISFSLALTPVLFLYCDDPDKKATQLLRESIQLMHGNFSRLLYLKLSFLVIFLLSILSCGVGLLFVEPYFYLTQTQFYESLVTTENGCA